MEVQVPRYMWHEWGLAIMAGEDVEMIERTDPPESDKKPFYWYLNSNIFDTSKILADCWFVSRLPSRLQGLFLGIWISLNLLIIFLRVDTVPVLLNAPKLFSIFNVGFNSPLKISTVVYRILFYGLCPVLGGNLVYGQFSPGLHLSRCIDSGTRDERILSNVNEKRVCLNLYVNLLEIVAVQILH
ncbi:hypothetical protein EDB82DRAFT_494726 [Fusarium venenatum]|uniref:uncharacterized protein n=1 Tax=Fusarium venenatum TaxID=56646 RepID=UPI001DC577F3|nr:hypothetical protein EDB82DRAFT_494726 [Fusarium venenatum]